MYSSYDTASSGGASVGMLLFSLVVYVIACYPMFVLFKKANYNNPVFAFIPILNIFGMLSVIKVSPVAILLMLIPIVNAIVSIIWFVKFLNVFGLSGWYILACLIPGGSLILLFYMALSSNVKYVG